MCPEPRHRPVLARSALDLARTVVLRSTHSNVKHHFFSPSATRKEGRKEGRKEYIKQSINNSNPWMTAERLTRMHRTSHRLCDSPSTRLPHLRSRANCGQVLRCLIHRCFALLRVASDLQRTETDPSRPLATAERAWIGRPFLQVL